VKIAQLAPVEHPTSARNTSPPDHDREALLRYLKSGRVIRAGRSLAPDELDPAHPQAVPLTAITDGEWIWSGAVIYYAEQYGLPVDSGLVEHARRSGYRLDAVSDDALTEAVRILDGDAPDVTDQTAHRPDSEASIGDQGADPDAH